MEVSGTGKRNRRQEQAEARREQLLSVALELFAEKGFRGTTIKEIAQGAGITEGLIYHYFPSKNAMLRAVLERFAFDYELPRLVEGMKDAPVREVLLRIGSAVFEKVGRNRRYIAMVVSDAIRDAEVAEVLASFISRNVEAAERFFRSRIASGELRPHDPRIPLRSFHSSIIWTILLGDRLYPTHGNLEPRAFLEGLVDLMLDGLSARSAGLTTGDEEGA